MDSHKAYNPIIQELNTFPSLYKSMIKLALETRLDEQKMIFVPFSAKELFQTDQEIADYYTFSKNVELEKISTLFTTKINEACNAYFDGNLNVNSFHEILDRIENLMPDVKNSLENLADKVPALAAKVQEFIVQHKEAIRIANNNISDSPIESQHISSSKAMHAQFNVIEKNFEELEKSVYLLKSESQIHVDRTEKTVEMIKKLESDIAEKRFLLNIHNSNMPLSRNTALHLLNLYNKGIEMSDEDFIIHLEGYAEIHPDNYNIEGIEGSVQSLINDFKTFSGITSEHENMISDMNKMHEELSHLRAQIKNLNMQINAKIIEQKQLQAILKSLSESKF